MGHPTPPLFNFVIYIDRIFCSSHILMLEILYMFILGTALPIILLTKEYSLVFHYKCIGV